MAKALAVNDLHLRFGAAQILQGVSLDIRAGALSIVGRNGMGKTTLCRSLMGLLRPARGTMMSHDVRLNGKTSHQISRLGIGYVPQGRMVWPSLSVEEHLRVALRRPNGGAGWSIDRVYDLFPRLAERRRNGGHQLSGGEQQMLAISRALLTQPRLLILDEPTEGLAPVIVDHVVATLQMLVAEEEMSILLVEQNLTVACAVSETVAIMVNGTIAEHLPARALLHNKEIQQRVLGVGGGPANETSDRHRREG